jgi:CRISPR-associated protein Csb2
MNKLLRITVRFLQPLVHGRLQNGQQEWPPSPLRLFQALVAAAAGRWNERVQVESAAPALRWLQQLPIDRIIACSGVPSQAPTQFYVPDNTADMLVTGWKKGESASSPKRSEKVVRPMHLSGDAVHYLFLFGDDADTHINTIQTAARHITHLGWGIDMAVGDAVVTTPAEAALLDGEHWVPTMTGALQLRVPNAGTFDDVSRKHAEVLNRLVQNVFRPVPPLTAFQFQSFRRDTDLEPRPWCMFSILKPDASGNLALNTARRTRDVAAWIRHAVAEVCSDWPDLAGFVHGHAPTGEKNTAANSSHRFQYLPIPSILMWEGQRKVDAIRRVIITAPPGCQDRIDFIRRRLIGAELAWQGKVLGILNADPGHMKLVRSQYIDAAQVWSTVTPVILDGFDDHSPAKTRRLLEKALLHAGLPKVLQLDWQPFGFQEGVEPVRHFIRPERLNGTMVHVRAVFHAPVPGPIAIGAGRYRGFGLFAREEKSAS